jgi:APA family basic amino acid/polyamine antiporter
VLRRDLGLPDAVALAVSMMLGTGIFFGPTITAREFPDGATVLLLWAAGGAVAITGAWVFGRLAARWPLSGGPYVYLREAFGPAPAFLFVWTSTVIIGPVGVAALSLVLASSVAQVRGLAPLGQQLLALWCVALFSFVNALGVKLGGRVQTAITSLKLALVAGIVALLLAAPAPPSAAPFAGTGRLSVAFVGILFAYGGWEMSALASEEVRDARRNVPRALLLGAGIVTLAYLGATAAYLAALGPAGVARASALAPEAAGRVLAGGAALVALAVAISAAGSVNALTLLCPRATFAVARDGLLPRPLARLAPRWATPVNAIALQAALSALYLLAAPLVTLAAYDVVAVALFVVLTSLTVPAFRRRGAFGARHVAAALLVAALYAAFIGLSLVENTATALAALGIVGAGLLPYALRRRADLPRVAPSEG